MPHDIHELIRVPGVPETALTEDMLARLPDTAPPAPWSCTASAVVWWNRGGDAKQALPVALRGMTPIGVVGGMVRYRHTPAGAYDEVFGNVIYNRGLAMRACVSFMSVDLPESLVGGRMNWSMPKTLARFEVDGEDLSSGSTMTARGNDWKVSAKVRALGPAVPLRSRLVCEQEWPDGSVRSCTMQVSGRGRPALVTVGVNSKHSLADWLKPGRHMGMLLDSVEFTLSPSERVI